MTEKPTLLLIDDEQDLLSAFKLWLEEEGYTVYTARSRQEALDVLGANPVGVCLIDLKLKGENGLELSREIKKKDAFLKIIIFTAYPSYDTAIDAIKMGVFDYVSKTMDQQEILEKIETALQARQEEISAKTDLLDRSKKIVLICHHNMIREGFENFCREEKGFTLLHTYHSVEYIKQSDFNLQAALVLLCTTCNQKKLSHPDPMFSQLQVFFPSARIAMLNSAFTDEEKMNLITLGARGFLAKNITRDNMKKAFKSMLSGEMWVARKVTDTLLSRLIQDTSKTRYKKPENPYQLSRREIEILQAMASGLSNFEISEKLFISEKTVKAHINHIFKKMSVKSRTQAVMKAMDEHVI